MTIEDTPHYPMNQDGMPLSEIAYAASLNTIAERIREAGKITGLSQNELLLVVERDLRIVLDGYWAPN